MHSFTPVTTNFHKTVPQMPFKSLKRGRWGSLHACIAWQIYYKEKLKKVQLKSKHLHQELKPNKDPSIQCNVDCPCAENICKNFNQSEGKTAEKTHHSSSYHCTSKSHWDKQRPKRLSNDISHGKAEQSKQEGALKAVPVTDMTWTQGDAPLNTWGAHDRKRHLEYPSFCKAKRFKQEAEEDFGLWSPTIPRRHVNNMDVSVFYSNSSRCTTESDPNPPRLIPSYAAVDIYQHQSASWDEYMKTELPFRQNLHLTNRCEPCGFTPFYCPPVFKQQHVKPKWFLQKSQQNSHIQHLLVPPASAWGYTNFLSGALSQSHCQ